MPTFSQKSLAGVAALLFAGVLSAQETPNSPDLPDMPVAKQSPRDSTQSSQNKNQQQSPLGLIARKSWFYPELARTSGPLTSGEKFKLFLNKSLSPPQIGSSIVGAAIGQAADSLTGYGQGWDGYSKRFGSSMASGASSHFFGTFLLPAVLHEDPRFFVKLRGGWKGRVGHALWRVAAIHTDDGRQTFNIPGTLGPLAAESLANTYLPDGERSVGKTFSRFGIRIAWGAANNVFKEYWPSIFKSLRIAKVAPGLQPKPPVTPPGGLPQ